MTIYRDVPLTEIPQGHYRVGLIDPPWRFITRSAKGLGKSPDRHYKTMTLDEIKALPVRDVFTKDAVINMWVIDTHLEMAFEVLNAWGFKYKTIGFYWAKCTKDGKGFPIGTGFWTRANPEHTLEATLPCGYCHDTGWLYCDAELGLCDCAAGLRHDRPAEVERCLLATRGHPTRVEKGVPRLIIEPKRQHSRKPDETFARIERLVEGPYLEMFSRSDRAGWDVWGDEAGMFSGRKFDHLVKLSPEERALIGLERDLDAEAEALI